MKFYLYFQSLINYILAFILVISIIFYSLKVIAVQNENELIENKLKNITSKLRCMTCQNQTIYESETDFSNDIKKIIRTKLLRNEKEGEIINFLIKRYGEYIVLEPQMNKQNIFLWLFPFIILFISLVFLIFRIKKRP